ncbi:MAG: hypothetical protein JSU96_06105, partial [Acidobacteriota bacterium]
MRCIRILITICFCSSLILTAAEKPKPFGIDEALSLKGLSTARLSPDKSWVVYTIRNTDLQKDKRVSNLFMVSLQNGERVQLTRGDSSDRSPSWSPNGAYLGFLSNR